MSPVPIQEPERIEAPAGGAIMSSCVWGAPGATPVVLLHGVPTNALLWRRLGPTLSAEGFRAFAPDLPGFGKSGDPSSARYGIPDLARYLDQFIRGVGLRDVVLVGHDIGGAVAQHFTASHPELVVGLVLVNSLTEDTGAPWFLRVAGSKLFDRLGPIADATMGLRRVLTWAIRSSMAHPARLSDPAIDAYAAPIESRGGSTHLATLCHAIEERDLEGLTGRLAAVAPRLLVVWGTGDPYLPKEAGRRLASRVRGAALVELEDSGHMVPEEDAFGLAAALLPFLRECVVEREERVTGRLRRTTGEFAKATDSGATEN
jgi:pimeloyl-ACP methyl ester carboxylesterase